MPKQPPEDFLSRWSRLKSEPDDASAVVESVEAQDENEEKQGVAEISDDDLSDTELLEKYALPDPDTMKSGDNFSVFMKEAVPDRLRRRALRVLWGSNPILANLDELVDYGEDFTDAATVVANMQTIYKVGKGSAWKFKEEQARIAEAKAAKEAEDEERRAHNGEPEEEIALTSEDAEEEHAELTDPEDTEPDIEVAELSEEDTEPPLPPPYRPSHMRFEFD